MKRYLLALILMCSLVGCDDTTFEERVAKQKVDGEIAILEVQHKHAMEVFQVQLRLKEVDLKILQAKAGSLPEASTHAKE